MHNEVGMSKAWGNMTKAEKAEFQASEAARIDRLRCVVEPRDFDVIDPDEPDGAVDMIENAR